ncbi:MAG: hypothetical protein DHS20C14_03870 [Phycisphaeraceae bacterium]|nr:MAG: hypothetical protein DHS20C14_03870 [Phycisphaeraceae bacterium]
MIGGHKHALPKASTHDAEDIVQQTMVSISSHIGDFQYDRDRGRFRNWVRTIAENKIKSAWRRRSTAGMDAAFVEAASDVAPSIEEVWEDEWRIQDLLWCLDQVARVVAAAEDGGVPQVHARGRAGSGRTRSRVMRRSRTT